MASPEFDTDSLPASRAASGRDSWYKLSRYTTARIALGRAGGSSRTDTLLEFRAAHARARDAVLQPFRPEVVQRELERAGIQTFRLATLAENRRSFLAHPDLGRRLSAESRRSLIESTRGWRQRLLAVIVSDGLSAQAAERQAVPTLSALLPLLLAEGWTVYPAFVVPFGRVKLQDEVGEVLAARHTLMLLGERPGLGSPDSLGAYLTFEPRADRTDADRNCVSNIRPEGLPPEAAARTLKELLSASAQLRVSGVALKPARNRLGGQGIGNYPESRGNSRS
jgi:ethanolamine ammonia-lyase small subunit